MEKLIADLALLTFTAIFPAGTTITPFISPLPNEYILLEKTLDLTKRDRNPFANEVFADNILLALHYFAGHGETVKVTFTGQGPRNIDWEKVRESFHLSLTLLPGETFAFHENLAPQYRVLPVRTSGTRYIFKEGYKAVGGLAGNGVCHLASLLNWAAQEAQFGGKAVLEVKAPVDHNFSPIPGIPKKYGTSILYRPKGGNSQNQNLYLKNNFSLPVKFIFFADSQKVILRISLQDLWFRG